MDVPAPTDLASLRLQSITGSTGSRALPDPTKPVLGEAARDFEALLLQQFLRAANEPVLEETPLSGGRDERMYREMFFDEVAKRSAASGGLGLAREIERNAGRGRE